MQTALIKCGIGENSARACHVFDELQERTRIQHVHQMARHRTESIFGGQTEFLDATVLGMLHRPGAPHLPGRIFGSGKLIHHTSEGFRIHKFVDHDMRKRPGVEEFIASSGGEFLQAAGIEIEAGDHLHN